MAEGEEKGVFAFSPLTSEVRFVRLSFHGLPPSDWEKPGHGIFSASAKKKGLKSLRVLDLEKAKDAFPVTPQGEDEEPGLWAEKDPNPVKKVSVGTSSDDVDLDGDNVTVGRVLDAALRLSLGDQRIVAAALSNNVAPIGLPLSMAQAAARPPPVRLQCQPAQPQLELRPAVPQQPLLRQQLYAAGSSGVVPVGSGQVVNQACSPNIPLGYTLNVCGRPVQIGTPGDPNVGFHLDGPYVGLPLSVQNRSDRNAVLKKAYVCISHLYWNRDLWTWNPKTRKVSARTQRAANPSRFSPLAMANAAYQAALARHCTSAALLPEGKAVDGRDLSDEAKLELNRLKTAVRDAQVAQQAVRQN